MALRDLFSRLGKKEEVEIPVEEEAREAINVRIENLTGLVDVDRILKLLREGNILFLKTKILQKKDLGEFQTSVQKLKRNCSQYGFDIVGTEDGYLILTPRFATIVR